MSILVDIRYNGISKGGNIWDHWLDCIMKKHSLLELEGAALLRQNGETAAKSRRFKVTENDFNEIVRAFDEAGREKISFGGVTYCIRSADTNQIVAFNGRRYIIINRTSCLYIIAKCNSRKSSYVAAEWVNKIAHKLISRKC